MAGITLTEREQHKAAILARAIEGEITNAQAAKKLGLSIRQIQRAKAGVREEGVSRRNNLTFTFSIHSHA